LYWPVAESTQVVRIWLENDQTLASDQLVLPFDKGILRPPNVEGSKEKDVVFEKADLGRLGEITWR
jgi:hypothetical protein